MGKPSLSSNEMIEASEDFETIYEAHAPLIYRFMFWRTKDEMLAQDLTSSVFEKAWRTRRNFSGGSVKAWLYRIARTTLVDYWRKRKDVLDEAAVVEAVTDASEPDEALDQKMAVADLRDAVAKLPKDMHDVVQLRFIEGYPVRQAAARLNLSEANVRVIQYRALKKLRDYLQ